MKDVSGAWPSQEGFDARFDWGPQGVERLAPHVRTIVIVDVLRFTSAVETACTAGVVVYPYRWKDDSAADFATTKDAILGGAAGGPSLSPLSLRHLAQGTRVVLPSPNGATCSLLAADSGAGVVAGCLRNGDAIAEWLNGAPGPVGVVACGEVWRDGSIRPSVEDMIGAGAILSRLAGALSPEAEAAAAAYERMHPRIVDVLLESASGRELLAMGREEDVRWCAALHVSRTVPVLRDGAFSASSQHPMRA